MAKLTLTLTGSNVVPSLTVLVRQSLVPWAEDSVTFANIGGTGFNEAAQTGPNLSSTVITDTGSPQTVSFAVPSPVIQSWIDNPSQNYGLFLITPATTGSDDKVFSSREGNFVPSLTFDVSPVPEPTSLLLIISGLAVIGLGRTLKSKV